MTAFLLGQGIFVGIRVRAERVILPTDEHEPEALATDDEPEALATESGRCYRRLRFRLVGASSLPA